MNRKQTSYLLGAIIVFISLIAARLINLNILLIFSYLLIFTGVYIFYYSFLKTSKPGTIAGSILFLSGSILFVNAKYEILNPGSIIMPVILSVTGISLLIGNIITRINKISIIISGLCLFSGLWLTIDRANSKLNLFLAAGYSILKNYPFILIGSIIIIYIAARVFKKNNQ